VVRHRTQRRLRHLVRDRLPQLPPGSMTVVRALPPAGAADSAALGRDLDATLHRLGLGRSGVDRSGVDRSGVDRSGVDPASVDPASVDPASVDPAAGVVR
jgi:ribonuclease P protein component